MSSITSNTGAVLSSPFNVMNSSVRRLGRDGRDRLQRSTRETVRSKYDVHSDQCIVRDCEIVK